MYIDKTDEYNKKHELEEQERKAKKGDRVAAEIAARKLTIFMESIDFSELTRLSRKIYKQAYELKRMTEQLQADSEEHHRKNLKRTKEYVADVMSNMSDDITSYICEFYKQGGEKNG